MHMHTHTHTKQTAAQMKIRVNFYSFFLSRRQEKRHKNSEQKKWKVKNAPMGMMMTTTTMTTAAGIDRHIDGLREYSTTRRGCWKRNEEMKGKHGERQTEDKARHTATAHTQTHSHNIKGTLIKCQRARWNGKITFKIDQRISSQLGRYVILLYYYCMNAYGTTYCSTHTERARRANGSVCVCVCASVSTDECKWW